MSEKLDGVRAYWSGSNFYSRQGNKFESPSWFCSKLPSDIALDGELWGGRKEFQKTVGCVKKKTPVVSEWKSLKYCVFDVPFYPGPYEERLKWLHENIEHLCPEVEVVGGRPCLGVDDLKKEVENVVDVLGGEGIMLRKPGSFYEHKRSFTLLKVKKFNDEEALVIGWKSDRVLMCQLPSGVTFGCTVAGSVKVGKDNVITFSYQELTNNGVPRFPVFLRVRKDVTWADVCKEAIAKQASIIKPTEEQKQEPILFRIEIQKNENAEQKQEEEKK